MKEISHALHGTVHKHPGQSKMVHEIRQKCDNPRKTYSKYLKNRVEDCETCAKAKPVPIKAITPELFNLPEWVFAEAPACRSTCHQIYLPVADTKR